jgi:hypothetical protein
MDEAWNLDHLMDVLDEAWHLVRHLALPKEHFCGLHDH